MQTLFETKHLSFRIVEVFFSLLQSSVEKCWAFSPVFVQNYVCSITNHFSASKAAQAVTNRDNAALNSAEFIFLPVFDSERSSWNLIILSRSIKQSENSDRHFDHCLHFFNGAQPLALESSTKNAIRARNREMLR